MDENEGKNYKHYNPVTVTVSESVGILVLGALSIVLLISLLRSQSRHRTLLAQLAGIEQADAKKLADTEEQPDD